MNQPTFDNMKHCVRSFGTPLFVIGFGIPRLAFPKLVTTFASDTFIPSNVSDYAVCRHAQYSRRHAMPQE